MLPLGGLIAGAFGAKKVLPSLSSNVDTTPYQNIGAREVDRRDYYLGGRRNYATQQNAALNKQAGLYGAQADADRQTQQAAVTQQQQALGNLAQAAAGQTPSVAELQANRQLAAAQSQTASLAASARGGGANLAAAQRAATNAGAQMQGEAIERGAMLRAQEMDSARNAYMQGSLGMGGQALDSRGQGIQARLGTQGQQLATNQASLAGRMAMDQQSADNYYKAAQLNSGNYNAAKGYGLQQGLSNAEGKRQLIGGLLNAGGSAGMAAMLSDKNAKEGIRDGRSETESMLGALKPVSYEYKDDGMGEGRRVGIIAQDLEKSPMGESAVVDMGGMKGVDVPKGLSLALAASADLHERVKQLEGKGKRA